MQENKGNYIIGSGISGLIWKYYHPEFQIISPDIAGGNYAKTYLVWFHDTFETRKLLVDLGLPIKTKKSYIGYYYKGWLNDNLTTDMNLMMIQKKMTAWDKPVDTDFVPKTKELSMSSTGGTNYMNCLDVDLEEVVKRLNEKNDNPISGFVTKIDSAELQYKTDFKSDLTHHEPYSKIISTMAAPFFWKAYGQEKGEFRCLPITNVIVKNKPPCFDGRYEMCYYDDSVPFSRISHMGDVWAIEITGEMTREKFEELYPDLTVQDIFTVKQGRIFENEDNSPPNENIVFSGRFAQWLYGVTTEHVIHQAINAKL